MLVLWPILIAGTLVGTVLLITLPLGALVWFLVLILARSFCRLEVRLVDATYHLTVKLIITFPIQLTMQLYFHSPLRSNIPRPVYFSIFKRVKIIQGPNGVPRPVVEVHEDGNEEITTPVWERNFLKNSWAMFTGEFGCTYQK
jgi:hypothetical protein